MRIGRDLRSGRPSRTGRSRCRRREWITGTNTACFESLRGCGSMVIALPCTRADAVAHLAAQPVPRQAVLGVDHREPHARGVDVRACRGRASRWGRPSRRGCRGRAGRAPRAATKCGVPSGMPVAAVASLQRPVGAGHHAGAALHAGGVEVALGLRARRAQREGHRVHLLHEERVPRHARRTRPRPRPAPRARGTAGARRLPAMSLVPAGPPASGLVDLDRALLEVGLARDRVDGVEHQLVDRAATRRRRPRTRSRAASRCGPWCPPPA